MRVHIRQATMEDMEGILEIVNHEILHTTVLYHYEKLSLEQQKKWFKRKTEDGMPVLVAELSSKVVGYGTFGIFRPWDAYRFSVEHSIYVHKDYRQRGMGKLLMSRLIDIAKQNGYHTMIAGVDGSSDESLKFHKKFGFEEVGTFKEIGHKFDKWLDLRFLQLFLE